jgi:predicted transcriptional regulator
MSFIIRYSTQDLDNSSLFHISEITARNQEEVRYFAEEINSHLECAVESIEKKRGSMNADTR